MTSDKPKPLIDLSHAKEPPRSLNLDEAQDTTESTNSDDLSHDQERGENVVEPQTTIANIPGAIVQPRESD